MRLTERHIESFYNYLIFLKEVQIKAESEFVQNILA